MRGRSAVVFFLFLLGCSDDSGGPESSGGTAGASGAAAGSTGGSGGATTAGATTGGASGSVQGGSAQSGSSGSGTAGGSGDAGASGSSALVAADLLPLADGNNWTYSIAGEIGGCVTTNRLVITGPELYEGRMAYRLVNGCSPDTPTLVSVVEGRIEQFSTTWDVSFGMPLAEGTTWQYSAASTFAWKAAGTVTVPAGTFDNCWKRVNVNQVDDTQRTYCPGVGRVLDERSDAKAELVSYELH